MEQDTIVGLIKDLTTRLSAVAAEFSDRAERVGGAVDTAETSGKPDADHRALALDLLAQRQARRDYFPQELFHEPAWDMLLALYVAHIDKRTMNVKTLVSCADAPVTTSQRWIDHLHKLRLIDRVVDPIDRRRMEISLSESGETALVRYLGMIARSRAPIRATDRAMAD